jgi:hypothetical protein
MSRKLTAGRRGEEKRKRRLKRLRQRDEGGFSVRQVPPLAAFGIEKMSDVLEEFVTPYFPEADNIDELRALFWWGIAAWNIALLPEHEQGKALEDIGRKVRLEDQVELPELLEFLRMLIRRKQKHFATNRRMIVSFDLRETGDSYYLNVASTLDLPSRP